MERQTYVHVEVGSVVSGWRKEAAGRGISSAEADRMESAFMHDDLRLAQRKAQRMAQRTA